MNYKLVMLENPILVENTVKPIDFSKYQYQNGNGIFIGVDNMKSFGEVYEIIAGIEGLPKNDLSLIADEIGWVDVEKLFIKYGIGLQDERNKLLFLKGFKAAQSLNEKKYSEEDVRKAFKEGLSYTTKKYYHDYSEDLFIKYLRQPKVYNVELEMEDKIALDGHTLIGKEPEITNNSIKIIKILK